MSQPKAREVPGGDVSRRVKSARVSGRTSGRPPCSMNVSKSRQIFRGREQAGVSCNAAQHAGVFVLHFALDDSLAETCGHPRWAELQLRHAAGGLNAVCAIPSGPNISR